MTTANQGPVDRLLGAARRVVATVTPSPQEVRSQLSRLPVPLPSRPPPRLDAYVERAHQLIARTAGTAQEAASRTVETARGVASRDGDGTAPRPAGATKPGVAYEEWTKAELYERAQELDIEGRSSMNKQQLIQALRSRG